MLISYLLLDNKIHIFNVNVFPIITNYFFNAHMLSMESHRMYHFKLNNKSCKLVKNVFVISIFGETLLGKLFLWESKIWGSIIWINAFLRECFLKICLLENCGFTEVKMEKVF